MSEREQAGAACPDCREDCISWVTDGQRCGYPRHPILTQLAEREKWDRLAAEVSDLRARLEAAEQRAAQFRTDVIDKSAECAAATARAERAEREREHYRVRYERTTEAANHNCEVAQRLERERDTAIAEKEAAEHEIQRANIAARAALAERDAVRERYAAHPGTLIAADVDASTVTVQLDQWPIEVALDVRVSVALLGKGSE